MRQNRDRCRHGRNHRGWILHTENGRGVGGGGGSQTTIIGADTRQIKPIKTKFQTKHRDTNRA